MYKRFSAIWKVYSFVKNLLNVSHALFRDFLLFTSHKSAKKCSTIGHTKRILRDDGSLYDIDYKETPHQKREYIEAEDKEMEIWLSIPPPKPGQPDKELKLIVTPFKKACVTDDHYYRKCPGTDKCNVNCFVTESLTVMELLRMNRRSTVF